MARNLKVSSDARRDMDAIYDHGAAVFGITQADRYARSMLEAFALLSAFPEAHPRLHAASAARSYRLSAHRIVYEVGADHVLILRVLHTRQLPPDLA